MTKRFDDQLINPAAVFREHLQVIFIFSLIFMFYLILFIQIRLIIVELTNRISQ